jgi:hypothetical protein
MTDALKIDPATIIDAAHTETLSGDIRDALLTHVRAIRVPWAMLAEDEQQATIDAIQHCAEHCVRQVVALVAAGGMTRLHSKIVQWRVKGGDLKLELAITPLVNNIIALAEHGNNTAVLVLADASEFIGEQAPAKADKNQPDLPLGKAA